MPHDAPVNHRTPAIVIRTWAPILGLALVLGACHAKTVDPPRTVPVAMAPGAHADHLDPTFWSPPRAEGATDPLDIVLLTPAELAALHAKNAARPGAARDVLADGFESAERVAGELNERAVWLAERLASGAYIETQSGAFAAARTAMETSAALDETRVVVSALNLRCVPMDSGLHRPPIDPAFDRNQCSRLRAGEVVRILRRSTDGDWVYASVGHGVGWVHPAGLSAAIDRNEARTFRDATERVVILADGVHLPNGVALRMGASLPLLGKAVDGAFRVQAPDAKGLIESRLAPSASVHEGWLPFTRRNVFRQVLSQMDAPYGWGGRDDGRDCSRLMLDTFSLFGLDLGRNSRVQSESGMHTQSLEGMSDSEKRAALKTAAERGVALIWMPGHIMMLLGPDKADGTGELRAISAVSEYLVPRPDGGHNVMRLDAVAVTDLELGRDTPRTAFIQRLKTLALFAR